MDRYCINQDQEDISRQVETMDQIYARSELTTLASAGEDPSHGLPGVVRVGEPGKLVHKLVNTPSFSHYLICAPPLPDLRGKLVLGLTKKACYHERDWSLLRSKSTSNVTELIALKASISH